MHGLAFGVWAAIAGGDADNSKVLMIVAFAVAVVAVAFATAIMSIALIRRVRPDFDEEMPTIELSLPHEIEEQWHGHQGDEDDA